MGSASLENKNQQEDRNGSRGDTDDAASLDSMHKQDTDWQFKDENYVGFMFSQLDVVCNSRKLGTPATWILLDSPSTVYVFCNIKLLSNIRYTKPVLILHCNT